MTQSLSHGGICPPGLAPWPGLRHGVSSQGFCRPRQPGPYLTVSAALQCGILWFLLPVSALFLEMGRNPFSAAGLPFLFLSLKAYLFLHLFEIITDLNQALNTVLCPEG